MFDRKEYMREYRLKNKDKVKEHKKRYYENNKEKVKDKAKIYYEANKEKQLENCKRRYEANKDKINEYKKKWYQENKDKNKEKRKIYYEANKDKMREYKKKWYQENKDKHIKRSTNYTKQRRKTDPLFRIILNMRNMMNRAIKTKRTEEILGCSFNELKQHLEDQFTEGMTWDNYGFYGWHIDHIVPLSHFNLLDEAEVAKANHYTNLQPLWAIDNLSKGNRYIA